MGKCFIALPYTDIFFLFHSLSAFFMLFTTPILVNQLPCIFSVLKKNDFLPLMIKVWFSYKAPKHHPLRRTWEVLPLPQVLGSAGGTGPWPVPTTVLRLHILTLLYLNSCQNLLSELQIYYFPLPIQYLLKPKACFPA